MIDARRAAELSKLKLSEEELKRLEEDLKDIYSLFEKLNSIEVTGEPMYTPSDLTNVARNDEPSECLGDKWISLAPLKEETEEGKFVVSPRPL
ncbi:hypothetical protein EYM_00200 [Ignicoccus islandicus DSM 13165]|uniref:Aspartyl/glutamyl-tRNA(Asn/Gln) amidotransferase subunit C n=1 Tax=Ignicoccus islandicus DSM 13165 TaxID=940295 RepID=A0A0U3ECC0_9CREN|nr:Asp-tRNA(Asn)/Glu-tRNA(Gln) amidotransferase subunit GatC [Ignicoccus islandicus]ALU12099.1 hypothetical protein EYM_00200 [Ignicoccus islandicus DSM 13165]